MKTVKFKTNIKCGACVAKVTPHLDQVANIAQWEVDLKDPNRILTTTLKNDQEENVIKAVKEAGYEAVKV